MELNQEQELFLSSSKEKLKEFIKNETNTNHPTLAVMISCSLIPRQSESFIYEANADFNIKGSYAIAAKIRNYVKKELQIERNDCSFKLITKFKKRELSMDNSTSNVEKKDDGLPDFIPVKPRYNFNQIILPETVRESIFNALSAIEQKELIFNTWGFNEVDSIPKSIINLYGPPGTGKTMCAHAVANYLDKPFLALNYSEIESKYVGDAAKNLKKAFETATKLDAVLFFDEADSFLGKRIQNVTQGSDQALNSLRSQMLILLEEFSGVVLFATNLVSNFDSAFNSRILAHIKLELPNREARAEIIKKDIPSRLPLERAFTDDEYLEVSDLIDGLSGREIKTAILDMLTSKAKAFGEKAIFTLADLKDALIRKKESIEALKIEEQRILKEKISKKLTERSMEEEAMENAKKEKEKEKGTQKEQDSIEP